jgi:hypothetical protein
VSQPDSPTVIVEIHEQEIVQQVEQYIDNHLQDPPQPVEHK